MKENKTQKIRTGLCIFVLLAVFGCASSGPKFMSAPSPKSGNALVYVYRTSSMVGAAGYDRVYVNNDFLTTLRSGGYAPYEVPQGPVVFYLTPRIVGVFVLAAALTNTQKEKYEKLRIIVEPGKTYYVKVSVAFSGHVMEGVDETKGVKEISGLHLCKVGEDK